MKNIIVVDMQKGFMKETNCHLIEKINNYLKQSDFDNIFFTQCVNNNDSPYTNILHWNGVKNEDEQKIVCYIPKNAKILTKNCYGISTKDIELFKKLNITEMEICGTDTDACVMAIAYNLFDNNIKPIILEHLCGSSSSNSNIHKNSIEIMKRSFGNESVKC